MRDITKRLLALEAAARNAIAVKQAHEPFVVFSPWSFLKDQFYLAYYPEGMYQKPQKSQCMAFEEVCRVLNSYPGNLCCQISMGACTEWLFAFHSFGDQSALYTEDQLDRHIQADIEKAPELAYMLTDEGEYLLQAMLKLPQSLCVKMSDLQQAVNT